MGFAFRTHLADVDVREVFVFEIVVLVAESQSELVVGGASMQSNILRREEER